MAVSASPRSTAVDTGRLIRSVVDQIPVVNAGQIPFLSYISGKTIDLGKMGTGKGSKVIPVLDNLPTTSAQRNDPFEWYEESVAPYILTSSGNLTSNATSITITPATSALYLTTGTLIQIDDEIMLVTAAGVAGGTATIARGQSGTTAASHTSASNDVKVVGRAVIEGSSVPIDPFVTPDGYSNYWQETLGSFKKTLKDTALNRYGDSDDWESQGIIRTLRDLLTKMERNAIYGRKTAGTSSVPAQFGGMYDYTSTKTNLSAAALTTANISAALQGMYDAGNGVDNCADTILTNSAGKIKLSSLYGNGYVTVYREETTNVGGYVIDKIVTDFGELNIIMSPYITPSAKELWLFKKDTVSIGPLKTDKADLSFALRELPETTLAESRYIYGVYTMCFQRPSSRALLYNFT